MTYKQRIVLYDVRSKLDPPAWSPNVWKVRFVLNFKQLPYTTEWLSFPDIAKQLSAAGVPPTRTEKPLYTVPAIIDNTDGKHPVFLSDSSLIVSYLEKTYPRPSIFPGGSEGVQMSYVSAINEYVYMAMYYMVIPTTTRILEGRDLEYYVASRKDFVGIALEDMFPVERRDAMWANLRRGLDELSALVDRQGASSKRRWVFSPVDSPSYADFLLGAIFIWFEKAGPEGGWNKIRGWNKGRWEQLLHDLQPYAQVL